MIIEESSSPGFSSKSSLRFLGGQPKGPRRRSSASSKRRLSSNNHHQQDDMMVDMQSFIFNQQRATEIETEHAVGFPSNSTSSTSTPNSNYANNGMMAEERENRYSDNDIGLIMNTTNADELTCLLNNVLNDSKKQQEPEEEELLNNMDAATNQQIMAGVDMARSTTTNSFSSSSSNAGNFTVPQQHQQQIVCGSFTPHSNCSPAIDTQGESVVITITPLSTLFTSDEEQQDKMNQGNRPVTRIVTCYCGNSCICPGCFVHPNNYIQQQQFTMQQQQYMQIQQTSSNSSSYSSDDEDQHHINYTAATNYSIL